VVVVAAYLDALIEPIARNDRLTVVLAGAIAVACCLAFVGSSGPERRAKVSALAAALLLAAALALAAVGRLEGWGHRDAVLLAYDLAVASIAIVLLVDLLRGTWAEATVRGLVIDLGATRDPAGLRAKLARALGDPLLVVGYRLPETGALVDDAGHPLVLPPPGSERTVTRLEEHGEEIGVLVHDEALLADAKLVESVGAAARIAVANVRLQAEARAQADQIEESRRRVVESTDRQRRRLELELREGPERLLANALEELTEASTTSGVDEMKAIAALAGHLGQARRELREFAQGIRPTALSEGGLMPALALLAEHSPIPTEVRGEVGRLPAPVEAALFFVCSEGLANAVKHAHASGLTIDMTAAAGLAVVVVVDDGTGGASLATGTGLRGLADRVEALGGRLDVESPPGGGTRVRAAVPLPA